jgi:transposase
MGGVSSALPHLSKYEFSKRLEKTTGREYRRWLTIWSALADPRPALEIAIRTNVSVSTEHNVISSYDRFGPKAVESSDKSKRHGGYLSKEQEAELLKPLLEAASTGDICSAGRIKQALQELSDHPLHHCPVYRMLHRNGWRQIAPRPAHPKADEETQETFMRNFPELVAEIVEQRDPEDDRPVTIMAQDEGRFGRITDIRSCWAPKGIRPKVAKQVARTLTRFPYLQVTC